MRTILLALTLCCNALLAADTAVSDGMSNGKAWNGLGGNNEKLALQLKVMYVVGLADGLRQAEGEITPGNDGGRLLPIGADLVTMVAALDEFYSDSQNLDIPIPMAARYERARLEGRDAKEQAESLKRLRILYKVSKELDSLEKK